MSISWIAILAVIGCALGYSALDFLRKFLSARIRPVPLLFYLSIGPVPIFLAWMWQALAAGPTSAYVLPALCTILLNIGANLAFLQSVRLAPLSVTIPLLSLTPVFTALLAIPLLGEVPDLMQGAGIFLVVIGVFLLNLQPSEGVTPAAVWRGIVREKGSLLMALTALLWAAAGPFDKLAMLGASPHFHGVMLNLGVGIGALLILMVQGRMGELGGARGNWRLLVGAVLVSVVALGAQLLAMTMIWVSVVDALKRAIGSVMAILVGRLYFAEGITAFKLMAVTLMGAGVAMILL